MEKSVSLRDAPQRFGELLREVSDIGDRKVVEEAGERSRPWSLCALFPVGAPA